MKPNLLPSPAFRAAGHVCRSHHTSPVLQICVLQHTFRRPPVSVLSSPFSIHYSPLPPRPLLCLPHSLPHCFPGHSPSDVPKNEADYFVGHLHSYFVRYLASNKESSLPGSLPGSSRRALPGSILSRSPDYRPSSFPGYAADNLGTSSPSFLASNEGSSSTHHQPQRSLTPEPTRGFDKQELVPTLSVIRKWTT